MVVPAKGREVVQVEGFPAMLQRLEVVDFQAAGFPAGLTPPSITIEGGSPRPSPGSPGHLGPGGRLPSRQRRDAACVLCG